MPAPLRSQRLGIQMQDRILYYEIDPDGSVYWLRVRADKTQRYRVSEPEMAEFIKEQGRQLTKEPKPDATEA